MRLKLPGCSGYICASMERSTNTHDMDPTSPVWWIRTRQVSRLTIMAIWTFTLVTLRMTAMPLALIMPPVERRLRKGCIMLWARGFLYFLGARIHLAGQPPKPPYLQVSNHLSYIDIFALQAIQGPVFVAKSEVATWPVFGWIARWMQTVFVDRERMLDLPRVTTIVEDILKTGYGVHIFPEGGIGEGTEVRSFKPGLFEVAIRAGIPVHYVAVSYETPRNTPPPSEWVVWGRGVTFVGHLKRLAAGPGFDIILTYGHSPLDAPDRKQLAQDLTDAVAGAYPGTD